MVSNHDIGAVLADPNSGAHPYLLTSLWINATGIAPLQADEFPRYFALMEDEPVHNGGRHEYGMASLHCDRHVLNDGRRVHVRGGCGAKAAITLDRQDKEKERLRVFGVTVLGMAINVAYSLEYDPDRGDWLPSWFPEYPPAPMAVHVIRGLSAHDLQTAMMRARSVWQGDLCWTE